MQDTQAAMQPFIKLAQSNMALLSQFSMSPEVVAQTMSGAQSLFQQGQGAATGLARSNAFAELMQGMLRNYTEFLAELGQSGMAMLAEGQSAIMQKAQDASSTLTAASSARGKRAQ